MKMRHTSTETGELFTVVEDWGNEYTLEKQDTGETRKARFGEIIRIVPGPNGTVKRENVLESLEDQVVELLPNGFYVLDGASRKSIEKLLSQ
jgi:hypothetical protein